MKNIKLNLGILTLIFFSFTFINAVAQDNILYGKIICGYQGWFNCYGDGSPVERWVHWSAGKYRTNEGIPEPGHLSFEIYPHVDDYDSGSLFQTGFAARGDGKPSKLYSSTKKDVIFKHFEWMQKYGIDGVALQRFLTSDHVFVMQKDTVALYLRQAAEKYGRIFYLMYDMNAKDSTVFKNDFLHMESFNLTASSRYAHQNGKPVICIWGFGLTSRNDLPQTSLNLINWLKAKGYYVIGGVPTHWREGNGDSWPDYQQVYEAFDMLSPWSVGRFRDNAGADNYNQTVTVPDKAFCDSKGIAYQPVVFSGFAWSNWNGGTPNMIPRNRGEFLWKQITNLHNDNIKNVYVAMFDEFDEGTAILSAADSYYEIPTDQYFLTTSADGTYISSDFYLRLVGKATKIIKGEEELTPNVPVPFSMGPVYFRTSLESGYDALPNWINQPIDQKNISGLGNTSISKCYNTTSGQKHIGQYALKLEGADLSATESYCTFKVFDVDIPISADTKLTYWFKPIDENGRYAAVDLLMTDGSRLKDFPAKDLNGISMQASVGHGTVNEWESITCPIGQWLTGKTIDQVLIRYDHPSATGDFNACFDDFFIYTGNNVVTKIDHIDNPQTEPYKIYPNPVDNQVIHLNFLQGISENNLKLIIYNEVGQVVIQRYIKPVGNQQVQLNGLKKGIYLLSISGRLFHRVHKIMVL